MLAVGGLGPSLPHAKPAAPSPATCVGCKQRNEGLLTPRLCANTPSITHLPSGCHGVGGVRVPAPHHEQTPNPPSTKQQRFTARLLASPLLCIPLGNGPGAFTKQGKELLLELH